MLSVFSFPGFRPKHTGFDMKKCQCSQSIHERLKRLHSNLTWMQRKFLTFCDTSRLLFSSGSLPLLTSFMYHKMRSVGTKNHFDSGIRKTRAESLQCSALSDHEPNLFQSFVASVEICPCTSCSHKTSGCCRLTYLPLDLLSGNVERPHEHPLL